MSAITERSMASLLHLVGSALHSSSLCHLSTNVGSQAHGSTTHFARGWAHFALSQTPERLQVRSVADEEILGQVRISAKITSSMRSPRVRNVGLTWTSRFTSLLCQEIVLISLTATVVEQLALARHAIEKPTLE